jgi:hypothetical protein
MRTMKRRRAGREPPGTPAEPDADHAMTALYQLHDPSFTRLITATRVTRVTRPPATGRPDENCRIRPVPPL